MFETLQAKGNWLSNNVDGWGSNKKHKKMTEILKALKVVNNLSERCIKDIKYELFCLL